MTAPDLAAPPEPRPSNPSAFNLVERLAPAVALLILLGAAGAGCRANALRRTLAPQHAEFLSKVRYIITRSEEKIFLEIPAPQRDAFIAEFWKRRNPDPYAAESEFKDEYFSRLEKADRLFPGEGKPGWLTDRGRIYILFGPPLDRIINPITNLPEERCSEIWYYGGFPVVFRDENCLGDFELVTSDLSPIREHNLSYMHELNQAQDRAQRTYYRKREPFDFRGRVRLEGTAPGRVGGVITLIVPYAGIWFEEPQVGGLLTTLEVDIELRGAAGASRWTFRESFDVMARDEILEREPNSSYTRDIPFDLVGNVADFGKEKVRFEIRLKNRTGGEEARKALDLPAHSP
jgi:GWxTD domain-containing protein